MITNRMLKKYRERVARGAKRLDEIRPGWFDEIRITQLDMKQGVYDPGVQCGCIGAQLDYRIGIEEEDWMNYWWERGEFGGFMDRMGWGQRGEVMYGLNMSDSDMFFLTQRQQDRMYSWMDEYWKDEIRERRVCAVSKV